MSAPMLDLRSLARWAATPPVALRERIDPLLTPVYAAALSLSPPRQPPPATVMDRCDAISRQLLDGRRDLEAAPRDPPRCPIPRLADLDNVEALAWYRSWHTLPSASRAIYLTDWGLHHAAHTLSAGGGSYRECLRDAIALLTAHELFHAAFDATLTQIEAVIASHAGVPTPVWRDYFQHVYSSAAGGGLEESLANAFALRTIDIAPRVRAAAEAWFAAMPGGYARYGDYISDARFGRGVRELLTVALAASYRSGPRGPSAPAESLVQQALMIEQLRSVPVFLLVTTRHPNALLGAQQGVKLTVRERVRQMSYPQRAGRALARRPDVPFTRFAWSMPALWAQNASAYDGILATARLDRNTADLDGSTSAPMVTLERDARRVEDVAAAWLDFASTPRPRDVPGETNAVVDDLLMAALDTYPGFADDDAANDGICAVVRLA